MMCGSATDSLQALKTVVSIERLPLRTCFLFIGICGDTKVSRQFPFRGGVSKMHPVRSTAREAGLSTIIHETVLAWVPHPAWELCLSSAAPRRSAVKHE